MLPHARVALFPGSIVTVAPLATVKLSPDCDSTADEFALSIPVRSDPPIVNVDPEHATVACPFKMDELLPQLNVSFVDPAPSEAVMPLSKLSVTF